MKAHGRKGIQMTEARRPINADRAGRRRFTAGAALACATAFLLATAPAAQAGEGKAGGRDAVRVCQDPNNLPFANDKEEGFENRIAELLGKHLGVPVTYFNYPQRFVFIRNTLRYKLPGEDYPCDVIIGVPVGFDQVAVTKPYYRSTYAMVFAQGKGLDDVNSVDDFLAQCATQEVLHPSGCPFGLPVFDRVVSPPVWSIVDAPVTTVQPDGTGWRIPPTDATAHIEVAVKSLFDGTITETSTDVPFVLTGTIEITPDGTVSISVGGD